MAASLYLKHFSLNSAPFPVTPDTDAYYTGGTRRATVDALMHVLRAERGIVKVVGEPGTGKTTLCRHLARVLGKQYAVIYTCDPSLAGDQTWYALADALRLQVPRDRPEVAAAAVRHRLAALYDAGRPALLLIDEAHALPPETLEQLRLLSQRTAGDETFRIALFGPEDLDHALAMPELEPLRTRIAHSLRLKRLKLSDIGEYLHFKMRACGWQGEPVFNANAVRAIAKLSGGVPRRINVLADKALLAAAMDRRYTASARDVAAAAKEVRLERRAGNTPRWLLVAGGFAAGVVVTALAAGLALQSGWIAPGPHGAALAPAPSHGTARPSTVPAAASGAVGGPSGAAPAPGGSAGSPAGTAAAVRAPRDPADPSLTAVPAPQLPQPRFAQDVRSSPSAR